MPLFIYSIAFSVSMNISSIIFENTLQEPPIKMPFGLRTRVGMPQMPDCQHSDVNCAEMAELVKIPFGLWVQVGPTKHVLDAAEIPYTKG